MYELVFYGSIVPGVDEQVVRGNIAKLMRANEAQLERMFSGSRIVLRNKMDKAMADKYQAALYKAGAICEIETMAGAAPPPEQPTQPTPVATPRNPAQFGPRDEPAATPKQSPATPASKQPSASSAPAREGALPLAGDATDKLLAGTDFSLAPVGSLIDNLESDAEPLFPDIDHLTLAEVGADMLDGEYVTMTAVPPPDISHLSLAPAGSDLEQLKDERPPVTPDISGISLAP